MTFIQAMLFKLFSQQRNIPYEAIQNIIVKQGVLDRIFALASLSIEIAPLGSSRIVKIFGMTVSNRSDQQTDKIGFSPNKISIPGLSKQNADILKGILQKMKLTSSTG